MIPKVPDNMPPMKTAATKKSTVITSENSIKNMSTRSSSRLSSGTMKKENLKDVSSFAKRKAVSPIKGNTLKRSALGNITNAIETQCVINSGKKLAKKPVSTVTKPTISTTAKVTHVVVTSKPSMQIKSMLPPLPKSRPPITAPLVHPQKSRVSLGGASLRSVVTTMAKPVTVDTNKPSAVSKPATKQNPVATKQIPVANKKCATAVVTVSKCKVTAKPKCMVNPVPNTRRSSGRRSTLDSDSSLYVSALSEVPDEEVTHVSPVVEQPSPIPQPLINIDEEYSEDPYQCATYANEIFEYLKSRESTFRIKDYMAMQSSLSQHVRAIVVDWMVEIQENFELNHETLYLGVKLMDAYLSQIKVSRMSLQLVAATAMFIASKYDERIPPAIDDFLYICDGAYKRRDITKMEVNILRVINFELGFPLSYRFLRRYARCAKVPMPLLTLARFILEFTLMDYSTISLSDSKMAAAALYIAFKMKKEQEWDATLIHFSGYKVRDFIEVAHILNNSLHQKPSKNLATVRNKYSHKIFYEVAKIPLVSNRDL